MSVQIPTEASVQFDCTLRVLLHRAMTVALLVSFTFVYGCKKSDGSSAKNTATADAPKGVPDTVMGTWELESVVTFGTESKALAEREIWVFSRDTVTTEGPYPEKSRYEVHPDKSPKRMIMFQDGGNAMLFAYEVSENRLKVASTKKFKDDNPEYPTEVSADLPGYTLLTFHRVPDGTRLATAPRPTSRPSSRPAPEVRVDHLDSATQSRGTPHFDSMVNLNDSLTKWAKVSAGGSDDVTLSFAAPGLVKILFYDGNTYFELYELRSDGIALKDRPAGMTPEKLRRYHDEITGVIAVKIVSKTEIELIHEKPNSALTGHYRAIPR